MDGNGMDTEAGRIDVVSCGIGFPKDAETLGLIGRADVVYGSRALLAACPVEARLTRIIGAKAREDAADALTLCRVGRHVVVLASGDALYHGFGGTLSGMAHPDDTIVYHPGITAFQALFHRLGLPWQDARLFSAHSGEALPARAIAEAPLSVAYAGSRYPAHAISQAVLKLHPASAGRAAAIAERLGSPEERLFSGPLADLARTECGPTSILLLLPTPWHVRPSYRRPDCSRCASRFRHSRRFPHIPQHPRADTHPWVPGRRLRTREQPDYRLRCAGGDPVAAAASGMGHAVGHRGRKRFRGARSRRTAAQPQRRRHRAQTRTRRDHRA